MASPINNNNPNFDVNSLFKPSPNPNPTTTASYPPPTSGPYPPFPPQTTPQFHPIYPPYPEFTQPMRSMSYPTPPLTPQTPNPSPSYHYQQQQNPNPSARLMALLSAPPDISQPQTPIVVNNPADHPVSSAAAAVNIQQQGGSVMRMPSSKLPKGRHLKGDRLVYDVNVKLPGEVQPQLEVTPITKYGSDPGLVIGRQIAVNKTYICYGLKLGAIRVLNINTASRSLLKGLEQRVTDMDFFAQDVHLLASASTDGRVYVWNIAEGSDEEDKPQITGKIVIAIQITGEGESVHPRVCWHCHKQEVLVVGIGKRVLKIDTTKVGRGEKISAEEPLICSVDKLIDGVQLVGSHDREVTDLSMCQWMTTRLVSASVDGTIKIWEDRKSPPIAVIRPHDGQPVNSVTFLAAPHRPDHIILITGGPFNREMKVWISASEEGWLLPSDEESWNCTQVLELKSSEARPEEAFFNQVVALSQAGLLLLANAKRNAIYAVHLEYGPNPASTRMDYLSEFTVTMPILSFTGTSELLPHGEQTVQVYCVQTQAIQQYALDLSRCLPPPMENVVFERSDSNISSSAAGGDKPTEVSVSSSAPKGPVIESGLENPPATSAIEFTTSNMESKMAPLSSAGNSSDVVSSPRASRTQSGFRSTSGRFEPNEQHSIEAKIVEYSVDRQLEAIHGNPSDAASLDDDRSKLPQDDIPMPRSNPIEFKPPTHLVKPSEFLMPNASSEPKSDADANIHDVIVSENPRNIVVEVNVVGETGKSQANDIRTQEDISVSGNKEKFFYSQASDLGMEMTRELRTPTAETFVVEEAGQFNENGAVEKQVDDSSKDGSSKAVDSSARTVAHQSSAPSSKGKKQKGETTHGQGSSSSSASPSVFKLTDSNNESINSSTLDAAFEQISSIQEMLNQLVTMQKESQKQMEMMVAAPVTKEGKRIEVALGKNMEKAVKANSDALWARFQEENMKREKASREHTQQVISTINNSLSKDLPAIIEKTVKRELSAVVQSVARTITPAIEKTIATSIVECFQKGVNDKAVNQLEKSVMSKLETTVARQIQVQFQTSGKQVLQESLKSSLEGSVIPAFEMSCRALFEQVDATFQKGMVEHTAAAQQQLEASHSPLALALRDAINSASSVTQTLSTELLDGQRKLLALATNSKSANPLISQLSNGPLVGIHEKIDIPLDPTKELSRLIGERKYEEAFTTALQRSDVTIVSWLCYQVDLPGILILNPLPLSQGVLLSLLQQLACDIGNETPRKLTWMRDVLSALNPTDPMIAVHVRPIFEQVYQILNHHRNIPSISSSDMSSIRLIMHVLNSMLMSSK